MNKLTLNDKDISNLFDVTCKKCNSKDMTMDMVLELFNVITV